MGFRCVHQRLERCLFEKIAQASPTTRRGRRWLTNMLNPETTRGCGISGMVSMGVRIRVASGIRKIAFPFYPIIRYHQRSAPCPDRLNHGDCAPLEWPIRTQRPASFRDSRAIRLETLLPVRTLQPDNPISAPSARHVSRTHFGDDARQIMRAASATLRKLRRFFCDSLYFSDRSLISMIFFRSGPMTVEKTARNERAALKKPIWSQPTGQAQKELRQPAAP